MILLPGNGARKSWCVQWRQKILLLPGHEVDEGCTVGNPKREGMMTTAASFPLVKIPRFNRPVAERRLFLRCCRLTVAGRFYQHQSNVETCTQTTNYFAPTIQWGCQAHRCCWTQRVKRIEWMEKCCRKVNCRKVNCNLVNRAFVVIDLTVRKIGPGSTVH